MNRIEFELEITGVKLKIKGTKEDVNTISGSIGRQLQGLAHPAAVLGDSRDNNNPEDTEITVLPTNNPNKKRGTRRPKQNPDSKNQEIAIDFRHEPEKYGNPAQKWTTAIKSIWLLYVVKNITQIDGMTSLQIKETFNKNFRQAKTITTTNISRDLGRSKVSANSLVGEDTSKNPHVWYLTDEGNKHVQSLIAEQKTQGNGVG